MALSLLTVSPLAGHTGGRSYVELTGTGFRLPTPQTPVDGVTPEAPPSMRVLFGNAPARSVDVFSETLIGCTSPMHDPTDGPIDVTVQILDDLGAVVSSAVLEEAYRFMMPDLTDPLADLTRVFDVLKRELERQVVPNVVWPRHVDYDSDGEGETMAELDIGKLPSLAFASLQMRDNTVQQEVEDHDTVDERDPEGRLIKRPAIAVDLAVMLVGVSDNSRELLNLYAATRFFAEKNDCLYVPIFPDSPEMARIPLFYEFTDQDAISITANADNLKTFGLRIRLEGIQISAMPGMPLGGPGQPAWASSEDVIGHTWTADEVTMETGRKL